MTPAAGSAPSPPLVVATDAGRATGGLAEAAALAVAAAERDRSAGVLMVEVSAGERRRRPTLLASDAARDLEHAVADALSGLDPAGDRVAGGVSSLPAASIPAARGNLCWLTLPCAARDRPTDSADQRVHGSGALPPSRVGDRADPGAGDRTDVPDTLQQLLDAPLPCLLLVAHLPPGDFARALDHPRLVVSGGLVRAELGSDRELAALAVAELHARGIPARVAKRSPGAVATRRALAGLDPGGEASRRAARAARALVRTGRPFPPANGTPRGASGRPGAEPRPVPGAAARVSSSSSEGGQAMPLVLGCAVAVVFTALLLAAIGGAVTGKGRVQRAADLAALSAARSMRDDVDRLLAPASLPNGAPNPAHMPKREYLARAAAAARQAAAANGVGPGRLRMSFPDAESFAPIRARARILAEVDRTSRPGARPVTQRGIGSGSRDPGSRSRGGRIPPRAVGRTPIATRTPIEVTAAATAEASIPAGYGGMPPVATGGGYSGPLAYRQGKPMRPDVAAAFDRLAAAARRAGLALTITSAFRSDAEQAELFAQNPDPTWVAPPGKSLHRCATELDLGPPAAYPWLAANATHFGFLKRYSWEPWHFGFTRGSAPCSAAGNAVGSTAVATAPSGRSDTAGSDGRAAGTGGLPAYVPAQFRLAIQRSAARWNVSGALLAAQLMAESNFNPTAVSSAGARGIAQFMPGTAAAYGLSDPFNAPAAIDAQAHLMSDLLKQFGSIPLALAAYNAGPGAVEACGCASPYAETQAYVTRILALLDGAGALLVPPLEVRLVR